MAWEMHKRGVVCGTSFIITHSRRAPVRELVPGDKRLNYANTKGLASSIRLPKHPARGLRLVDASLSTPLLPYVVHAIIAPANLVIHSVSTALRALPKHPLFLIGARLNRLGPNWALLPLWAVSKHP